MALNITNCTVRTSKDGPIVLDNPTSAVLNDEMTPTMNIVITGGATQNGGVQTNKTYWIQGTAGNVARTIPSMKTSNASSPRTFKKL